MKTKGTIAFRILGISAVILGIMNIASAIVSLVSKIAIGDMKLPMHLFYFYCIVCLIFGFTELYAGISANRACSKVVYRKISFQAGITMIILETLIFGILILGKVFKIENLSGYLYPVIYSLLVKICR